MELPTASEEKLWVIGDIHPTYGTVQMMGVLDGERIRWFVDKHGSIAMIPLDILNYGEK